MTAPGTMDGCPRVQCPQRPPHPCRVAVTRSPRHARGPLPNPTTMRLSALYIHPIKSCASLALDEAEVRPRGLAHDRRWLIVDESGRFLTGRQLPALVRLRATPRADGLTLDAPGMPALHVPRPPADAPRLQVQVWKDSVDAALADAAAAHWLTQWLGRPVRLVHMDAGARRPVRPDLSQPGDLVSFADAFPLLAISQSALDQLNTKLATPVPIARFRPNLVIDGCRPHAEDGWRRIRIGAVEFDVSRQCVRCVFTTVDTERGAPDPSGEPLNTLKGYRRGESGVTFGVHLIARGGGTLRVGDAVTVLA